MIAVGCEIIRTLERLSPWIKLRPNGPWALPICDRDHWGLVGSFLTSINFASKSLRTPILILCPNPASNSTLNKMKVVQNGIRISDTAFKTRNKNKNTKQQSQFLMTACTPCQQCYFFSLLACIERFLAVVEELS